MHLLQIKAALRGVLSAARTDTAAVTGHVMEERVWGRLSADSVAPIKLFLAPRLHNLLSLLLRSRCFNVSVTEINIFKKP